MNATPEQIAAGLSEELREDLLNGRCGCPRGNEEWTPECLCSAPGAYPLIHRGLAAARSVFPGGIVRTDLGLAVQRILKGEG